MVHRIGRQTVEEYRALPIEQRLDVDGQLCYYAEHGDMKKVRALLRRGANPRFLMSSPLREAMLRGHAKVAETLIRAGANLDDIPLPGDDFKRIVDIITYRGHMAVLKLLERHGIVTLLKERRR